MHFPFVRNDHQQTAIVGQGSRHLAQRAGRFSNMLQRDDVDTGLEAAIGEGKRGEIGNGVQLSIVPGGIADREIDGEIPAGRKIFRVDAFSGAGIQHSGAGGKFRGETGKRIVDRGFEVQNVASQEARQNALDRLIRHAFRRAYSMMVDPAPQAASSSVNGSATSTRPK